MRYHAIGVDDEAVKPVDKIKSFAASKNLIPSIPFTDTLPHLRVAAVELVARIQRDFGEHHRLPTILTVHYYVRPPGSKETDTRLSSSRRGGYLTKNKQGPMPRASITKPEELHQKIVDVAWRLCASDRGPDILCANIGVSAHRFADVPKQSITSFFSSSSSSSSPSTGKAAPTKTTPTPSSGIKRLFQPSVLPSSKPLPSSSSSSTVKTKPTSTPTPLATIPSGLSSNTPIPTSSKTLMDDSKIDLSAPRNETTPAYLDDDDGDIDTTLELLMDDDDDVINDRSLSSSSSHQTTSMSSISSSSSFTSTSSSAASTTTTTTFNDDISHRKDENDDDSDNDVVEIVNNHVSPSLVSPALHASTQPIPVATTPSSLAISSTLTSSSSVCPECGEVLPVSPRVRAEHTDFHFASALQAQFRPSTTAVSSSSSTTTNNTNKKVVANDSSFRRFFKTPSHQQPIATTPSTSSSPSLSTTATLSNNASVTSVGAVALPIPPSLTISSSSSSSTTPTTHQHQKRSRTDANLKAKPKSKRKRANSSTSSASSSSIATSGASRSINSFFG
jgi:hypothetical protein